MDKKLEFLLRSIKDDIFGTGGVKSYAQQLESLPTDLKNGESLYIWNKARLPDIQRVLARKLDAIAKNLDEYIATLQEIHGAELDMFKTTVSVISADSLVVEPSTTNRFGAAGPVDSGPRTTNRFGAAGPAPSRNAVAVAPSGGAELDMHKTTLPVISADSIVVESSTTKSDVSGGPAIRFRKRGLVDPGPRTTNRFGAAGPAPSRNAVAVAPSGGAVGGRNRSNSRSNPPINGGDNELTMRNRSNSRSNSPINWGDHELTMGELALGGHFGDVAEGVALSSTGKHTGGAHRRRRTHKVRARKQRKSCKSRSH